MWYVVIQVCLAFRSPRVPWCSSKSGIRQLLQYPIWELLLLLPEQQSLAVLHHIHQYQLPPPPLHYQIALPPPPGRG